MVRPGGYLVISDSVDLGTPASPHREYREKALDYLASPRLSDQSSSAGWHRHPDGAGLGHVGILERYTVPAATSTPRRPK